MIFEGGYHHSNPQSVFEAAIKTGFFSENPVDENFVGNWMYMHHTDDGRAHFKHYMTRHYIVMPATDEPMQDKSGQDGGAG